MNYEFQRETFSKPYPNFFLKLGKQLQSTTLPKRRKSKRRSPTRCNYGSLEDRKMLASAAVVGGTLEVTGDGTAEVLSVRQVDSDLIVYAQSGSNAGQNIFRTSAANVDSIVIQGGGGNDQLINRTEIQSVLIGSGGDDILVGGTGDDVIRGGFGNDRLTGDFGANSINISTMVEGGSDRLVGGDGDDAIFGVGGDDVINGESGNDLLFGGVGNDNIVGSIGNDKVSGDGGNDLLSGNDGNDLIRGELGNDVLLGGNGDDILIGGEGSDRLRGNLGADRVSGGRGDDVLLSDGDAHSSDRLIGGHGDDTYHFEGPGEAGLVEVVVEGTLAHDTIVETSFSGNDTIEYSGPGFKHDLRADFNKDSSLVFRYDLRLVATETTSTIENFLDLREELVTIVDTGNGDPLIDVDLINNESVVNILNRDDTENNGIDLLNTATNPIDSTFEQDISLDLIIV